MDQNTKQLWHWCGPARLHNETSLEEKGQLPLATQGRNVARLGRPRPALGIPCTASAGGGRRNYHFSTHLRANSAAEGKPDPDNSSQNSRLASTSKLRSGDIYHPTHCSQHSDFLHPSSELTARVEAKSSAETLESFYSPATDTAYLKQPRCRAGEHST